MPGQKDPLSSAESVMNSSDVLRFYIEYLNSLTPTGFPDHRIVLKVGMSLIKLQNLNPNSNPCN